MTLYEIVKALQSAQGGKAKQAILEANKSNELLREYMKATYDPALAFFQKKAPTPESSYDETLKIANINGIVHMLNDRVVTGKEAIAWLKNEMEAYTPESQELIALMISRSIGAGVGDTMVLNTWPGLYFLPPYNRCATMSDKIREHYKSLPYFFVQTKRDGSFAYLQNNQSKAVITRQGSLYPAWFSDKMVVGVPFGYVLAGEMEVYLDGKLLDRKTGNGVLNSVLQSSNGEEFQQYEFKYVAWDVLPISDFKRGRCAIKYEKRLNTLESLLASSVLPHLQIIQTWKVSSIAEANKVHLAHTSNGKEGTVWKTCDGGWCDTDSGNKDAVKNKVVFEAEFEVIGWYEGEGKAKGSLGGFTVATSCRKLTNNVGSGFSDKQRKQIWQDIQEGNGPMGAIVTLEANDIISAKGKDTLSLSLPIFIEVRFDRTEADSLERVMEQLEAAKNGR